MEGRTIAQSFTIARYLARQHGLAGNNDLAAAEADVVIDSLVELLGPMADMMCVKDEQKKAEKRKKTAVETAAVDLPSQEELMQVSISKLLYYYSESAMPKNTPGAFTCKSCDTERNLFCNHTFVYVRSVKNSQITFFKCQNTA